MNKLNLDGGRKANFAPPTTLFMGVCDGAFKAAEPALEDNSPTLGGVKATEPEASAEIVFEANGQAKVIDAASMAKASKAPVLQEYALTGVTFSKYPFDTLRLGQPVYLVPDPYGAATKNEHPDPTAMSVQDAEVGGRHIGYIPKASAKVISTYREKYPLLHIVANVSSIKGGYVAGDGTDLNYGIDILVQFYESKPEET